MPKRLEYTAQSCWEAYSSPSDRKAMDETAARYIAFLSRCKTERESVEYVVEAARGAGLGTNFAGNGCYEIKNGKSVILARKGKRPLSEGVRLVGAHCDTPRLDLKQHPLYEECRVGLAKTHYYGGIRKYQWLARPLALHGVVVTTSGKNVRVVLGEDPDEPVFAIADLLPHLAAKQAEQKLSEAFDAEKLNVILGHAPSARGKKGEGENALVKRKVLEMLHAKYAIIEEDLYSAELQLVPAGPARFVGLDGSLIGGYGQDDRICVFCGLEAFLTTPEPEHSQLLVFWDKEETGSEGAAGAKSRFMEYFVEKMVAAWEPQTRPGDVYAATRALSADVHGALDPDYQDVHDKLNSSLLGYGPVLCKYTGHKGKYGASEADAEYVAWLRGVFNAARVPWQMASLGKVDVGGGGTVAKYLAAYGMHIIDFGPGLISMHSPFEIGSKADLYATIKAMQAFFGS